MTVGSDVHDLSAYPDKSSYNESLNHAFTFNDLLFTVCEAFYLFIYLLMELYTDDPEMNPK